MFFDSEGQGLLKELASLRVLAYRGGQWTAALKKEGRGAQESEGVRAVSQIHVILLSLPNRQRVGGGGAPRSPFLFYRHFFI